MHRSCQRVLWSEPFYRFCVCTLVRWEPHLTAFFGLSHLSTACEQEATTKYAWETIFHSGTSPVRR